MGLRIKDNVDLKELKKFGFKKRYYNGSKKYVLEFENNDIHNYQDIIFDYETRKMCFCNWGSDVLYDLIKAGLVEKREDNE